MNGIDVSKHNGSIDWKSVKASGFDFAMIRAGYGNTISQKDSTFEYNIQNALANGLKIGIYYFSYALSIADATQEATICDQIIKKYKDNIFGVFFDYEYDSANYYTRQKGVVPTKDFINQCCVAFCNKIESFGYHQGLYFNNDYRKNILTQDTINSCGYKWLADYSGNPDILCDFQQTSSTGKVNGINGNVDINISFISFGAINDNSFVSDTTQNFSLSVGCSYQFKITAKNPPVFSIGTDGVFIHSLVSQSGNDYFYKIIAIGKPNDAAGIYVNGKKLCVVSIKEDRVISDTPQFINIKKGATYQFKLTAKSKPNFVCGSGGAFAVNYAGNIGNDYFFKVTALANVGDKAGFYINGEKSTVATII